MAEPTIDQVVDGYLRLRDQKALTLATAKAAADVIDAKLVKLEGWIKAKADEQGVTSFRTKHGTAFLTTTDYANVGDWDAIVDFIKQNEAYDLLEKRISKNAVRGYIDMNKTVPPGVNYGTKLDVNIRKPAVKLDE